jgi:Ni,Fe-hydrogenase III large subunit
VPGGVAVGSRREAGRRDLPARRSLEAEVRSLKAIYDEHATLQDRFANTGIVKPELAARLGLTGLAGRASAQAWDARAQFPQAPYDQLDVNMATQRKGDVLARAEVRFAEVYESLRLIREILNPAGRGDQTRRWPRCGVREGLGWVEGWRGESWWRCGSAPTAGSTGCTRTTPPGRTGRCWKSASSATSSPTSR